MGTKEELTKVWTTEAERIETEAVERVRREVAGVEYSLNKLVADWKVASDGLSPSAFELLAKGGRVMSFEVNVSEKDEYLQCSLYHEGPSSSQLHLPKGSYRIIILAIRKRE